MRVLHRKGGKLSFLASNKLQIIVSLTQIKGVVFFLPHAFENVVNLELLLSGVCNQLGQAVVHLVHF